jgi:hypothetical protein
MRVDREHTCRWSACGAYPGAYPRFRRDWRKRPPIRLQAVAICEDCGQEMNEAASCVVATIELRAGAYERVKWGDEPDDWARGRRCGDCGVVPEGIHHLGCDIERCPRCGQQLIGCECWPDED